jgi:hypothetical protein
VAGVPHDHSAGDGPSGLEVPLGIELRAKNQILI